MTSTRTSRPGQWPGRSTVLAKNGMVCCSQPLAATAALDVLRRGGNAIDAAICASATLAAVEPLSTGVGGDMIALFWTAKEKKLKCLNGTGRCPQKLSWRTFARRGAKFLPNFGWGSVTVPGCVDGWWTMHQDSGKMPWANLFDSAIDYARDGAPLSEIVASDFDMIKPRLQNDAARAIFAPNDRLPEYGELFKQSDLANTLEAIARGGADAFYRGTIMEKIVASSDAEGGYFSREDFTSHHSTWDTPLKTTFRGVDIFEPPPNTQGFTALLALNILSSLDLEKLKDDWAGLTHATMEAIKLAFAERDAHTSDSKAYQAPLDDLLSLTFATHIGMTIDPARAIPRRDSLINAMLGDTVQICTADTDGNVVSLISSLYQGSGVVAGDTGIHFHNRASMFSIDSSQPNAMEPGKRPFHTLMPGFALLHGKPYMAFGVTGGHHQPQGHVQFLLNFLLHGMTLQEAVSAPRFDCRTENVVALESDFPPELRESLLARGHVFVENDPGPFGGAQALRVLENGVMEGASDPRKDGGAVGF
jgi:gamma-glutamyltranspeptidase/glutathione hydrolase